MNIARKLQLVEQAIRSIAEHDDADEKDVKKALAKVGEMAKEAVSNLAADRKQRAKKK